MIGTAPLGRRDDEIGSATVYVLAMVMVLICLAGAAMAFAGVVTARHRAAGAADLAALAAASALDRGEQAACARAAAVARAQRSAVTRCLIDGSGGTGVADLSVAVDLPGWLRMLGPAVARARAG